VSDTGSQTAPPPGLLRSNLTVALGTTVSRITGLARVAVFGIVIGQTALADAYDGANNSPNSIYELLLGGVLSATLVPLFTRQLADRDEEATEAVVSVAIVALAVITVASVAAAPWIFRLFALSPAAAVDAAEYRSVGTTLARIFLIQIFFYGLTALATALLNSRRRYFAAAWAPVASNLVIIASLLTIPSIMDGARPELSDIDDVGALKWVLGLGATAGIATMALILVPAVKRAGVRLRFRPDWRHPAVRTLLRLSGWTLGYVIANQVSLIVVKNLASPGSGGQDAYTKAFIFFQLPHGLLAMSISTTFVPELARRVAARDRPGFIAQASLGIRLVALLTIPASLGLLALSRPIVGALLQHGQFTEQAAITTSRALAGFSIGLVGFSVYLFVLRAFYAHQDTRTPFVINVFQNLLNIVLAFALVQRHGVLGLSLAFSLSYLVASLWALSVLSTKLRGFPVRSLLGQLWPMLLSSVLMAEIVWLVTRRIGADSGAGALTRVAVGTVLGATVYLALLMAFRVPDLEALRSRVARRSAPHPTSQ
jgi:putative peptidoglycan lipid II flippase